MTILTKEVSEFGLLINCRTVYLCKSSEDIVSIEINIS